ncbi:MAG: tetratricopeptide repeat protein [Pseudomonadota bacterium]
MGANFEPYEQESWIELKSDNFILHTSLNHDRALERLHQFELIHHLVSQLSTIDVGNGAKPTRILLLEDKTGLRQLGVDSRYGGVFLESLRENLIVIRDARLRYMHEEVHYLYIKHLLTAASSEPIPTWITEGIAHYLRTLTVNHADKTIRMGMFSRFDDNWANSVCGWASVRELLNSSTNLTCDSAIQADWPFREILQIPKLRRKLGDYLTRLRNGESSVASFSTAFDIDIDGFESQLAKYSNKKSIDTWLLDVSDFLTRLKIQSTKMKKSHVALMLGKVALQTRQVNAARHWSSMALSDAELRGEALAVLGMSSLYEKDVDAADTHFSEALEIDPENVPVLLDTAKLWLRRGFDERDTEIRQQHLARARSIIGRAWKIDDTEPEVYALYGRSFILQKDYKQALDSLEAAVRMQPSHAGVILDLAHSYHKLNRESDAEQLFDTVARMAHFDFTQRSPFNDRNSYVSKNLGDPGWKLRKRSAVPYYSERSAYQDRIEFWY